MIESLSDPAPSFDSSFPKTWKKVEGSSVFIQDKETDREPICAKDVPQNSTKKRNSDGNSRNVYS